MPTIQKIENPQRRDSMQMSSEVECCGERATTVRAVPPSSGRPRRPGKGYLFAKRAFDIVVASAALVVMAPVMMAIAIVIRIDSPGPAIFCHRRAGADRRSPGGRGRRSTPNGAAGKFTGSHERRGKSRRVKDEFGKPFTLYKFRTMYADARERFPDSYRYEFTSEELKTVPIKVLAAGHRNERGCLVADSLGQDPRVTRVGHWLRRTSLDELPNFINVLLGDLSVVGPRPDIALNIRHYDAEHMEITRVKPGVTGLAQVRGRGHLSLIETNEHDLEYVRNMSFVLDTKIVLLTIRDCLRLRGAY